MKPSWKDAPDWANWLAMDEDGEWRWYENEPEKSRSLALWQAIGDRWETAIMPIDWTTTLEPRPKGKP